jgi:predicted nucleic acid-binding Zn finger protein
VSERSTKDEKNTSNGDNSRESNRLKKARTVVDSHGVKLHKFHPSGREIWTVVGSECDFLVQFDPADDSKVYCACGDFYYRVLSGKTTECYHLLACKIAFKEQMYVVVNFSDEEFPAFLRALVSDDFRSISSQRASKAEPQA